jgi:hypothetical protein
MATDTQSRMQAYRRTTENLKHWSRESQPIAPVEILLNRIQRGWTIEPIVYLETHVYGPGRTVSIYHFTLKQESEKLEIPVQVNPVVRRLIEDYKVKVVPFNTGGAPISS